jgi:hypothetical protein
MAVNNILDDQHVHPKGFYPECKCGQIGPLFDWIHLNKEFVCERCMTKLAFWKGVWRGVTLRAFWDWLFFGSKK